MRFVKAIRPLVLVFGLLILCFPVYSQLNYGRIFGVLTDQSGGAIVGATVTVTDVQRGVSRALTTDSAGAYNAPNLIPGTYTVRAEFAGFRTVDRQDIHVEVGQDIRIDFALLPGEQNQLVTVTGEAPELNTTNSQLGGTLENETVLELPMNGRQYTQLLNYRPGMEGKPGVGPLGYSSNGNRNNQQVWMFDGLFSTNLYSGGGPIIGGAGGGGGLDESTILPLDAIQEINIIENPKAEYGWSPGGQVNVGLKSGTNSIHGSAYAFGRDAALAARNPYVTTKPTTVLEQYGATVGGPIKKDKLFYFGAFEANNYDVGVGKVVQVPASLPGGGASASFPDAIAGINTYIANNPGTTVALNQLSLNLAGCTAAGVCNAANGVFPNPTASSNVQSTEDIVGGSKNGLAKIDYHLNDQNALNFEYFFGNGSSLSPGSQSGTSAIQSYWRLALHARAQVSRAVWVFTPNSTWVNEARFGYDNTSLPASVGECVQNLGAPNYAAQFGFVSGAPACGFPVLTISGFSGLGAIGTPTVAHWGNTMFSDAVSYTHGKHLFKFGFEIHNVLWGGGVVTNAKGTVNFGTTAAFTGATALEDYLAGDVSSAAGQLLLGSPIRQLSFRQYASFVQDDWAITRRFTLNLGLRYEYNRPITEPDNLIGNFDPTAPTGMIQATNGQPVFNGDHNNFGPRLGVAWDVTGKGTTVVRAGGSIVFTYADLLNYVAATSGSQLNAIPTGFTLKGISGNTIPSPGTIQVGNTALTPSNVNWTAGQAVFNSTPAALACGNGVSPNPSPCPIFGVDKNFKQGYVTTWTLGVQHAFTNNLSLDVAYVGDHGTKLSGDANYNAPTPGVTSGEQSRRPFYSQFPYLGAIEILSPVGISNYNALQATLVQRATRNLSFTVGYTYSHDLDEATGDGTEPMNTTRQDYGNSANDATHHVTISGVYALPGIKSPAQLLEGWQVSATASLLSGFAWNPLDSSDDISGTANNPGTASSYIDRWTLVGNAKDFNSFGAAKTVPCFGSSTSTNFTTKNGCTVGIPQACLNAAAAEPSGPTGASTASTLLTTKLGCYMVGNSVIVPPSQGTFGTMPRDALRTPPFHAWDLSITKNTKIREWLTAEFRTEIFNVFNTTAYSSTPNANLAAPVSFGLSPSSPNSSNSLIGSGGPRTIQFGLKFIY